MALDWPRNSRCPFTFTMLYLFLGASQLGAATILACVPYKSCLLRCVSDSSPYVLEGISRWSQKITYLCLKNGRNEVKMKSPIDFQAHSIIFRQPFCDFKAHFWGNLFILFLFILYFCLHITHAYA